ncbi:hypothetical protein JNUCC1_00248 [Lentibacillus sp. JNUCC-1]|uniref:GNAT family N-acetyltransferase n=1 Tax=Lentibacillus sp. JNUCC-1 TaxID=2654513 RepID=UPI0012E77782|nr:GNAT family N-acetyltransferase [Lentibacillus sp. JNUCC-1]MUV36446.1 hypothetical protein [Lentibacillus sp. JNUCC-1]
MKGALTAEGVLKTTGETFKIQQLHMEDCDDVLLLQKSAQYVLDQPEQLEILSREEVKHILSGNGYMAGAFLEERLIAFRAMLTPEVNDPEHLGTDAGLPYSALPHVIYSEITIVHPNYRGNGLQTYMGRIVLNHIDRNQYRYVASTVAPFNIPSLKDKLVLGMEIIVLKEKYGGKLRYVLFRDLDATHDHRQVLDSQTVSMEETHTQVQLLDKGYKGTSFKRSDRGYDVTYQKYDTSSLQQ